MGLPIVTALFGLGTGISLVGLDLARARDAELLDRARGDDRARRRDRLRALHPHPLSARSTARTAARCTRRSRSRWTPPAARSLFAGATVVIALLGMFALGVSFLYGLAIAASLAVLLVLAASITLLPALLTLLRPPGRRARPARAARRAGASRGRDGAGFWAALDRHDPAAPAVAARRRRRARDARSSRRPRSGCGSARATPATTRPAFTTRHAYDLLAQGFGPGLQRPALARRPAAAARTTRPPLDAIATARRARRRDVASVAPPRLSPAGDVAMISAYPALLAPEQRRPPRSSSTSATT